MKVKMRGLGESTRTKRKKGLKFGDSLYIKESLLMSNAAQTAA